MPKNLSRLLKRGKKKKIKKKKKTDTENASGDSERSSSGGGSSSSTYTSTSSYSHDALTSTLPNKTVVERVQTKRRLSEPYAAQKTPDARGFDAPDLVISSAQELEVQSTIASDTTPPGNSNTNFPATTATTHTTTTTATTDATAEGSNGFAPNAQDEADVRCPQFPSLSGTASMSVADSATTKSSVSAERGFGFCGTHAQATLVQCMQPLLHFTMQQFTKHSFRKENYFKRDQPQLTSSFLVDAERYVLSKMLSRLFYFPPYTSQFAFLHSPASSCAVEILSKC